MQLSEMQLQEEADLLGDTDSSVTACEADAVDSRVLSQKVSNLGSLSCRDRQLAA